MSYAVVNMPTISTDHLTATTCAQLDNWCATIDLSRRNFSQCPTLMAATDYGWLIYCTEETDHLPLDLVQCFEWADNNGYNYILFDADGDQIAELANHGGPAPLIPRTKKGRKPATRWMIEYFSKENDTFAADCHPDIFETKEDAERVAPKFMEHLEWAERWSVKEVE
jgi:hypothetical protein